MGVCFPRAALRAEFGFSITDTSMSRTGGARDSSTTIALIYNYSVNTLSCVTLVSQSSQACVVNIRCYCDLEARRLLCSVVGKRVRDSWMASCMKTYPVNLLDNP